MTFDNPVHKRTQDFGHTLQYLSVLDLFFVFHVYQYYKLRLGWRVLNSPDIISKELGQIGRVFKIV
jgi:hypothetical protein